MTEPPKYKRVKPSIKAPSTLSPELRRWYTMMAGKWELDPQHLELLRMAAATKQLEQESEAQVKKDGLMIPARNGMRSHPLLATIRDCRALFSKLIHQLHLDEDE